MQLISVHSIAARQPPNAFKIVEKNNHTYFTRFQADFETFHIQNIKKGQTSPPPPPGAECSKTYAKNAYKVCFSLPYLEKSEEKT